jgi:hypothetical protein
MFPDSPLPLRALQLPVTAAPGQLVAPRAGALTYLTIAGRVWREGQHPRRGRPRCFQMHPLRKGDNES